MKKTALLLALALLLVCLASAAWAETLASGTCGENVTWTVDGEGTLTISGSSPMEDYYERLSETSIRLFGGPWNSSQVKRVVIEEGVTHVGGCAFFGMDQVEEAIIGNSVESIGLRAFYDDPALRNVTIPASVTSIEERVFYECKSLLNITVSAANPAYKSVDGVLFTKDGKQLLNYCPGRTDASYTVPDGVQVIQATAFSYASALEEVHLPDSLLELQGVAFACTGLKSVVFPPNLQSFGYSAFHNCENLTSIALPVSLKSLENNVFKNCPLAEVRYEGSESQWNMISFDENNSDLLNAPIQYNCLIYCQHGGISWKAAVPHTCTEDGTIAHWACDACGRAFSDAEGVNLLGDITDPAAHSYESAVTLEPNCSEQGVRTYTCTVCGEDTPGHSYTRQIAPTHQHHFVDGFCDNVLHDGVTVCNVQENVASGACGDSVNWRLAGDGILYITGTGPMRNFNTTTVYHYGVPYKTYVISPWSSYEDEISAVIVAEGVTVIGAYAFNGMAEIQYVNLPSTLTRINSTAFSNNTCLSNIYYTGSRTSWNRINSSDTLNYFSNRGVAVHCNPLDHGACGDNVSWAVSSDGTLTISGTGPMKEYYQDRIFTIPQWRNWENDGTDGDPVRVIRRVVIQNGVATVGSGAFRYLEGLEEVELSGSVTSIGAYAFYGDMAIRQITIPEGVASIGTFAFYDTGITRITIPASVESIGERALYACTSLREITVNSGNTAYKSVNGVLFTKDGKQMLSYCPGRTATSYTVPDGVELIWPSAFSYSAALKEVNLPDSLVELKDWAFGHTGLTSVTLPQRLETLRYCAFGVCEDLTVVSLPASLRTVEEAVFLECPLADVYYAGTDEDWDDIDISEADNEALFGAALHAAPAPVRALHLPAQLTEIGEAAFESGTFNHVYLGENVQVIGTRAFADCVRLKYISIPDGCETIAEDAFAGCPKLVIVCGDGSAAQAFAESHGISWQLNGN